MLTGLNTRYSELLRRNCTVLTQGSSHGCGHARAAKLSTAARYTLNLIGSAGFADLLHTVKSKLSPNPLLSIRQEAEGRPGYRCRSPVLSDLRDERLGLVTDLQSEHPAKILTSRSGRLTCKARATSLKQKHAPHDTLHWPGPASLPRTTSRLQATQRGFCLGGTWLLPCLEAMAVAAATATPARLLTRSSQAVLQLVLWVQSHVPSSLCPIATLMNKVSQHMTCSWPQTLRPWDDS